MEKKKKALKIVIIAIAVIIAAGALISCILLDYIVAFYNFVTLIRDGIDHISVIS